MTSIFLLFGSFIFGRQQPQIQPDPSSGMDIGMDIAMSRPPYISHDPNTRTEFMGLSCRTIAYPSFGGIVLGYFSAVELVHLDLPHTKPTNRSSDPAEEDNLAHRMLRLGAHWWPSWYMYHFPPIVNVGYPSSGKGVWVFKFSADEQTWDKREERKPYLERKPDDWNGRIGMALTMDERCEIMKDFGATFYEKVEDCEDIAKTLQEGIEEGKRYEELLKKMADMKYVDKWLTGSGIGYDTSKEG